MVSSPKDTNVSSVDNDTLAVYPACAVTRAMAKRAQSSSNTNDSDDTNTSVGDTIMVQGLLTQSQRENETESQIELADTIVSHGRELGSDMESVKGNVNEEMFKIVNRDQLIERNCDFRPGGVSESEAVQEPISYYRRSGVLTRRWRPPDAQCDED